MSAARATSADGQGSYLAWRDVHVFWTDSSTPAEIEAARLLLDDGERSRADAIAAWELRAEIVVARAFVRRCLAAVARPGTDPRAFAFRASELGKPEVQEPASARDLRFSVSKTTGLIACAVARGRDVGVDVEPVRPLPNALQIADRRFAECERAGLRRLPEARVARAFLTLWTLKEAHAKALGLGLTLPLDRCAFDVAADGSVVIEPAAHAGWRFHTVEPTPDHVLAVAVVTPAERR